MPGWRRVQPRIPDESSLSWIVPYRARPLLERSPRPAGWYPQQRSPRESHVQRGFDGQEAARAGMLASGKIFARLRRASPMARSVVPGNPEPPCGALWVVVGLPVAVCSRDVGLVLLGSLAWFCLGCGAGSAGLGFCSVAAPGRLCLGAGPVLLGGRGAGGGGLAGGREQALTNGRARRIGGLGSSRPGYSVLRNSAMATASMAAPIKATMATDSPTGTTQPNHETPGLSSRMARELTGRWLNTAWRIG